MKNKFILALGMLSLYGVSHAQISEGGLPTTFKSKTSINNINYEVIELAKPDMQKIVKEDALASEKGNPYRVSALQPTHLNIHNSGTWETLPNGDKTWRLGIKIKDAQALSLYFSAPVTIPEGGKLHAYNKNHAQYVGAYTSNTPSFQSMEMIEGELLTLEYYMPKGSTELPMIEINNVAYYYRGVEDRITGFRDAGAVNYTKAQACEVDVACDEINGWEKQRDAVVHYVFLIGNSGYVCSASVVNNTAGDCKPYILTANHCGTPTSNTDITHHTWYFNYQRPSCQPGVTAHYNGARSQTMSGGKLKASSELGTHPAQNQYQVTGADFVLVELNSSIPSAYNPYYAGWTRATSGSHSGVGIHHPNGDEKKISTYTSTLGTATYNGGWYGAHWSVVWSATQNGHGVTEGGSSGSPIFNQDGLIVGYLSGGGSSCSATNQSDLYGKFLKAWDQDGNNPNQQLKHWLDPINSGAFTLQGTYAPCQANYTAISENILTNVLVSPNPVKDYLTVNINDVDNVLTIEIRDVAGRIVKSQNNTNTGIVEFDLSQEKAGVYFVTVTAEQGSTTQKIIKL